jgi:hypothetical protein
MPDNSPQLLAAIPTTTPAASSEFTYDRLIDIVYYLVSNALLFGELLASVMIVYYGLRMAMARGDAAVFGAAKSSLVKVLIGATIIFGVWVIIETVRNAVGVLTG